MRAIDALAAEWVDARGDDRSIGHYREPILRKSLEELLVSVRREALTTESTAAEMYENEACALVVDGMLGDGNKVSAAIRARMRGL